MSSLFSALVIACCLVLAPASAQADASRVRLVDGIVWQPDNAHADPRGDWDKLGAHELIVQWTAVDGIAFVPGAGMRTAARMPDWERIGQEPWARDVIVGLAGRVDEAAARATAAQV